MTPVNVERICNIRRSIERLLKYVEDHHMHSFDPKHSVDSKEDLVSSTIDTCNHCLNELKLLKVEDNV